MARCTVFTVRSRSDDDTLYVLTPAGQRPQRFGHVHDGEVVTFDLGQETQVARDVGFHSARLELTHTCPICDEHVVVSEAVVETENVNPFS